MSAESIIASLGPAGAVAGVMYLWLRSVQQQCLAEQAERRAMTASTIEAVRQAAALAESVRDELQQLRRDREREDHPRNVGG